MPVYSPGVSVPRQRGSKNPARVIALGAASVLVVGTCALMLPISYPHDAPSVVDALFTAVSAMCVTGLATLDTQTAWTPFGQFVIAALIHIGGLGVMTLATLLSMAMLRKLGVRTRLMSAQETRGNLSNAGHVVRGVLATTLVVELSVAFILFLRFLLHYHLSFPAALGRALFHSVSAFNNAGFAMYTRNLIDFNDDPWILMPIAIAVILGGLGFPVVMELVKRYRTPMHWSLTTKLMMLGTPILLVGGTLFTIIIEWTNPGTIGSMPFWQKLMNAFFHSTVSRTAGFSAIDNNLMHPETWLLTDVLMIIGGGPAGTAGGLKITTVLVLLAIVRGELRGDPYVLIFGKRLSRGQHREVITIVVLMVIGVITVTATLMLIEPFSLDRLLYECISAASTTGLSTGITASLHPVSKLLLCVLMFAGRVGPTTLGVALALRRRPLMYEPAKERPLIG